MHLQRILRMHAELLILMMNHLHNKSVSNFGEHYLVSIEIGNLERENEFLLILFMS